jgi:16S rRNA (uracil1498-N3)-methyltransferase
MLQRIVVDPANIQPPTIQLTAEHQHYLSRVLRLCPGDRVIVMDGQGHAWLTELNAASHVTILETIETQTELPVAITLVMALPKGNGFDDIVRQATELGVSQIQPVSSDRTLLKPSSQKRDRWLRIMQEAAEQSERQIVPTLLEPLPFQNYLNQFKTLSATTAYLCTPRQAAPHLLTKLQTAQPSASVHLAIGPEGGWTDAEIETAIAAGYQLVSLGDRILRAVTAPLVAIALVAAWYDSNQSDQKIRNH